MRTNTLEHALTTPSPSITAEPELAPNPPGPVRSKALSYVRELGVKPEQAKTVLVGASIAAALALVVIAVRARKRRRVGAVDSGNGVLGTVLKGALFAALQTVVKVKAAQLAAKALHSNADRAPVDRVPVEGATHE